MAMEGIIQAPYDATVRLILASLERNLLPDAVIRRLSRLLFAGRLRSAYKSSSELQLSDLLQFVHSLRDMPIAIQTDKPKTQHYELPTSFFKLVLGKHFKYSCCYFSDMSNTLDDAEKAMLELYCERSQLKDGHTVLDVGCGWGSLSLYIAQKYSNCKVTGICNSKAQKAHIEDQCRALKLQNVETIAADINTFEMEASYDRIYSIGMFEHMKNYGDLLKKISKWMKEDSLLFVQYFCHKTFAYHFEFADKFWQWVVSTEKQKLWRLAVLHSQSILLAIAGVLFSGEPDVNVEQRCSERGRRRCSSDLLLAKYNRYLLVSRTSKLGGVRRLVRRRQKPRPNSFVAATTDIFCPGSLVRWWI